MKLYEPYPAGVTVDGKFYKLNFDFRNVFRMMETLSESQLIPEAREYLALKCLTKHPRNVSKVLEAAKKLLFEEKEHSGEKASGERVTSFVQDAGLIRAAFRQVYRIDLARDKLHWLEFIELLHNLPEGTRYTEIVGIRSRPMPPATKYNQREREWLAKAKAQVALHMSEDEAARKYDNDVQNIFAGLMSMIPKEVINNNGE